MSNQIKNYDNFCESKNCPEFIRWDCGEGICISCKLIGQSYNINEYPKECIHLKEIEKE